MDLTTLSSLGIVSVLVSLLVQFLKTKFGGGATTVLILIALSIIASGLYLFFKDHLNYWEALLSILVGANAVYSFLLQWFEKP